MDSSIFGLSMNEAIEIIRDVDPDLPYISIEDHDLKRLRSILG